MVHKSVLILAVLIGLSWANAWTALDPEEASYIYTHCMEDFMPRASNPLGSLQSWIQWGLGPDEETSYCYVRCCLVDTGLYDPASNSFKPGRIQQQYEAYQSYDLDTQEHVTEFTNAVDALAPPRSSDDCKALFDIYKPVHLKHKATARNIYHGDLNKAKLIYDKLGSEIKQRGQTYSRFCEKKVFPNAGNDVICAVREISDSNTDSSTFKDYIDCLFEGIGYTWENGTIDHVEFIRDFQLADKNTDALNVALEKCASSLPENDDEALHYYKCLLADSSVSEDFRDALTYRNVRSKRYSYLLKHPRPVYDKEKAKQEALNDDGISCP